MQIRHLCNQTSRVEKGTAEEYKVVPRERLFHGRTELGTHGCVYLFIRFPFCE